MIRNRTRVHKAVKVAITRMKKKRDTLYTMGDVVPGKLWINNMNLSYHHHSRVLV